MVITQCDDHPPRRARVEELGIRLVHDTTSEEFINMQLHPRDTGGTFFEIDQVLSEGAEAADGPWHPAGPDWQQHKDTSRVGGIVAAEIQCDDPLAVATRWCEIAEVDVNSSDGTHVMAMENATVRFVSCTDGRPEGLGGIDVKANDLDAILASAESRGCLGATNQVMLCGMRVNLV